VSPLKSEVGMRGGGPQGLGPLDRRLPPEKSPDALDPKKRKKGPLISKSFHGRRRVSIRFGRVL